MRRALSILVLVACMAVATTNAHAFDTRAIVLTTPANARIISMGDIGVADNSDPSTIFFNPANVCAGSRLYGLAAQQRFEFSDDLWLRRANVGFSSRPANSALSVGMDIGYSRLSYGNTVLVDSLNTPADSLTTYEDVVSLTTGFAARAGDVVEFRFGGAVKIWRGHFDEEFSATSFDAGMAIDFHERYGAWNIIPSLAAAVVDLGQDIEIRDRTDPLPTRANFGAALRVESAPCKILGADVPLLAIVCQAEGSK